MKSKGLKDTVTAEALPWQLEVIERLNKDFLKLKQNNHRYSLRAYAKKLGISPSALSELMNKKGRWKLSPQRAAKLIEKIDLRSSTRNRLLVEMKETPRHKDLLLSRTEHDIFLDWTWLPTLFMFDLPERFHAPQVIAKKMGLSVSKVRHNIDQLVKRKFLNRDAHDRISRPQVFLKSTDGIPSSVVKQGHRINLDLSQRAFEEIPFEKRDFTSLTFAGNAKKLEFLRQEIRALHEKAAALMDDGDENDEVFKLNIQLFPIQFNEK